MSGTERPSHGIHRLNSKFVIFLLIRTSFDRQYNMKMCSTKKSLEHVIDHLPWGTL